MITVATVSAMHEQVHERAGGQQEPWEHSQQMRPMLGPEEEGGNRQEGEQRDASRRTQERLRLIMSGVHR
jgi:hypothetical protein